MKSKQEIYNQVVEASQNIPNDLDTSDMLLLTIVSNLLHDAQDQLSDEQQAELIGVCAILWKRFNLPTPAFYGEDGEPCWSIAQMAAMAGKTPEEIEHQICDNQELQALLGAGKKTHRTQ